MDLLGFTDEEVKEINSKALKGRPKPMVPDVLDPVELPEISRFPPAVQETIREAWSLEMVKRHMREANEAARASRSDPPKGLIVKVDKRAPTAVHMLWVRVGSMDEVDGVSGVAHVLVRRRRDSN